MVIWKWGVASFPAISGLSFGIHSLTNNSQEVTPPPPNNLVSVEAQQFNREDSEEKRIKQEANTAFQQLDDYTFKMFSSCNSGTGWILDYQISEKGKYPTTWYIATNAHVIQKWIFDSNPYEQRLPILSRNRPHKRIQEIKKIASKYSLSTTASCHFAKNYEIFDFNLSKQIDAEVLKSNLGAIGQNKIKDYKLFWVAIDLFDKNLNWEIKRNNYKDFAVIEIEFSDEKSAREITRGFADKYNNNSEKIINIFSEPLDIKTLDSNNKNFYSLGYSKKENDIFGYTKNWNESSLRADRLSKDLEDKYSNKGVKLTGHVASKRFANLKVNWGGKELNRMGHFYLLDGKPSGKGSSGSMVIDGDGNLIGVKSIGEQGVKAKNSMYVPLRSNGLIVEGNFKTPQYDLILGAPYQKSSYKQQVEKFLQPKGVKTWLSSMEWKSKS